MGQAPSLQDSCLQPLKTCPFKTKTCTPSKSFGLLECKPDDVHATLGGMWRIDGSGTRILLWAVAAGLAGALCASAQTSVRLQTREAIESHLKSFSTKNDMREGLIRKWLAEAGCKDANLSEQEFDRKLPPNVICILPGETPEIIVVGAHTDHVDVGDGVVDNWTGAVLLPALLYSLSAQPRHHTFVFVGFSAEEKGLVGSEYYVEHLARERRGRIEGMVNFDSLGLGPTEVWASHADKVLLDALDAVALTSRLPVSVMDVSDESSADSEAFAEYQIRRITLHSVTQRTLAILHSEEDRMAAIRIKDYLDSYRLAARYLVYLDDTLKAGNSAH
jgi:hypothetical protein